MIDWLTEKIEANRKVYTHGPRRGNERSKDIALGQMRAYRNVRTEIIIKSDPHSDDYCVVCDSGEGVMHPIRTIDNGYICEECINVDRND